MKDISVFQIVFDFDFSKLKDLPGELDKILKDIQSTFSDLSEKISRGTEAIVTDISAQLSRHPGFAIATALLLALIELINKVQKARSIFEFISKGIKELVEGPPTDLERLQALETKARELRALAEATQGEIIKRGESPDTIFFGLPLDKEVVQERIDLLSALIEKIALLREELMHGALKSGIPEQPKIIPIPKFGQPGEAIVAPLLDPIKLLEEELKRIIESGNEKIVEQSQLLPLLKNALASLGITTSAFADEQGLMNDAVKNGTASTIALVKDGISPLTEKTGEYATSLVDLVKNAGEGALIFGRTKEELGQLLGVTEDVTESTKELGKDGLQGAIEQAGQAEKTLGTLESTMGNAGDKAETLDKAVADGAVSLEGYEASLTDVDTAAQTAADGGLTQVTEKVQELNETGGFFDGIKQGFEDFVESVGSNSELMANFFADTLSQMSQSFSDLFFNVLTGKFDSLVDIAKQAFEAILRAFLDLVSAIATRQLVISIAGVLGFDTKGAKATDVLGLGKEVFGAGSAITGAIGGGSAGIENTNGDEDGVVVGMFSNRAEVEEVEYRMAA